MLFFLLKISLTLTHTLIFLSLTT